MLVLEHLLQQMALSGEALEPLEAGLASEGESLVEGALWLQLSPVPS